MAEIEFRKTIQLSVLSPEKSLFSGEVLSVVVPGEAGSFGIYPNHAPLVASLDVGVIRIRKLDGAQQHFVVDGGFVEVRNGTVNVLADGADSPEEINLDFQKSRLKEAEKMPPSLAKVKEIKKAKTRIFVLQS